MYNLYSVYFANFYMFRAYLGPSSGRKPYVLYLLMMGLDTPETCRGWGNILRISCASSCFFFLHDYLGYRINNAFTSPETHIIVPTIHEIQYIPSTRPNALIIQRRSCRNFSTQHFLLVWQNHKSRTCFVSRLITVTLPHAFMHRKPSG